MDDSNLRLYKDFRPETELLKEEAAEILRVKLPGFARQQLRVLMDRIGNLRITGERPIVNNQSSRFRLDFRVPENSNMNAIRAKFESGILDIIIPYKKITPETTAAASSPPPPRIPDAKQPRPDEPRKPKEEEAFNNRPSSNNYNDPGESEKKISQPTSTNSTDGFPAPIARNNYNGDHSKDDEKQDSNAKKKKVESSHKEYMDDDEIHRHDQESKISSNGYERFGPTKTNGERQQLIVNIVVAALVLVGLGMYVFFRLGRSNEPSGGQKDI